MCKFSLYFLSYRHWDYIPRDIWVLSVSFQKHHFVLVSFTLRDNPTAWQTFSAEMADTRVRQNTCYFVPPRREICSSAGEGWKTHYHWARNATSIIQLAKRTQKCGSQLQENFACTVMQRLCSIHTKHIEKSRRNKIKIKHIIAEAIIGGLF